ncbi:MAG: GrpE protein [Frankiales bacterium]|nr:GrpE protein [Frankiales bacterium]
MSSEDTTGQEGSTRQDSTWQEEATAPERVVIRDKRRLDPDSGEVRPEVPMSSAEVLGGEVSADLAAIQAELTADLQRLTAEYANYRKRVERDRIQVLELATAGLLESLLPLLDSIELARQHGDLEGAFKGVGEGLEQVADKHGLERYGAKGDVFDPLVHHALVQAPEDPEASVTVVAEVLQPGWRLRSGRVLRPAGVAVAEPGGAAENADVPSDAEQPNDPAN